MALERLRVSHALRGNSTLGQSCSETAYCTWQLDSLKNEFFEIVSAIRTVRFVRNILGYHHMTTRDEGHGKEVLLVLAIIHTMRLCRTGLLWGSAPIRCAWTKTPPVATIPFIMADEHAQRRINRLLDEVEAAIVTKDSATVRGLSQNVLRLKNNVDSLSCLTAAERDSGSVSAAEPPLTQLL